MARRPRAAAAAAIVLAPLLAHAPAASGAVLAALRASAGGPTRGLASVAASAQASQPALMQVGPPTESQGMLHMLHMLESFKAFAQGSSRQVAQRHAAEEQRLEAAIQETPDEGVKLALEQSVTSNTQSFVETVRIYRNIVNFSDSMTSLLSAATSTGYGCEQVQCGVHASCTDTTLGAQCVCNEGYVGTGHSCAPPAEFLPHLLLAGGAGGAVVQAADVEVSVFELNKVAVVYRDVSAGNVGRVLVGSVRDCGLADLSPPEQFTGAGGRAFGPVVVGTASKRVVIAWRDENRGGACWVRGSALGTSGIRGAELAMVWGEPVNFCTEQAHKMAFVTLPGDHVALFYSDRARATDHTPAESFGNSFLARVSNTGSVSILGQYRFTDYPVCRLEVTKLTPTAFVLAARAAKAMDDMDSTVSVRQEAMAMYGELVDDDLVFDPNPVNLEPEGRQIWARGVSLIAPNTFAYAYQDGQEMKMKMAVLEVDPATHRMEVAHLPVALRDGFSPYVSTLSVPYTPSDPHTLTYYQDERTNTSMVNVCSWIGATRTLERCEDFPWLNERLLSVSGVHLGGGKSFLVFTTEANVPYYGVFGLSKK